MRLLMGHPELASRPCSVCKVWRYRDDGSLVRDKQTDEPMKRAPGERMPCLGCPKCGKDRGASPEVGRECDLSEKNRTTLRRFWERAKGDDITQRNFGVIREIMSSYKRSLQRSFLETVIVLAGRR